VSPKPVGEGVWVVTAGAFPSNSYICEADVPGGAVLVDCGLDAAPIDAALHSLGLQPAHVFCTHGHFDHLGTASFFQKTYGAPVHLHPSDHRTARANNFLLMAMKLGIVIELPQFTDAGDAYSVQLGNRILRYRHAPGHTPGSCVIQIGQDLFTGDTLYASGIGLSKLPGERPDQLRETLLGLWDDLDGVRVHPGHGPSRDGIDIKRRNSALRAFIGMEGQEESLHIHAR
jgi:hydroxyacylglutathione hydrolase